MKYAKLAAERARIWVKQMEPADTSSSEASFDPNERPDRAKAEKEEERKLSNEYKAMLDVGKLYIGGNVSNPLKRQFFFT